MGHNIETRPVFKPMHLVAAHHGMLADQCPVAEQLSVTGISLPCSTSISDQEVDYVIDRLGDALDQT